MFHDTKARIRDGIKFFSSPDLHPPPHKNPSLTFETLSDTGTGGDAWDDRWREHGGHRRRGSDCYSWGYGRPRALHLSSDLRRSELQQDKRL